jgi:hypothetical protein
VQIAGLVAQGVGEALGQCRKDAALGALGALGVQTMGTDHLLAPRAVLARPNRRDQPHRIEDLAGRGIDGDLGRDAVGLALPIVEAARLDPALGAAEEAQITEQRIEQCGLLGIEVDIGPGRDQLGVGRETDEAIEDQRGINTRPLEPAHRHVVARVGAYAGRHPIRGQLLAEALDQAVEQCLRKPLGIGLAVPGGDECAQDTPRRRRPLDIGLVDVAPPRRRMESPGGESEGYGDHDYFR